MWYVYVCVPVALVLYNSTPLLGELVLGWSFMSYRFKFLWDVAGGRCQDVSRLVALLWCTVGTWDVTRGKRGRAVPQHKDTRIMFDVISYPWKSRVCFWASCLLA